MKVKICGITNLDDALVAADAGADLLGFICYARSPRYVEASTARSIVAALEAAFGADRPKCVGVFVNAQQGELDEALAAAGFDLLQLHGDEPPELLEHFGGRAYKAIRPATHAEALIATQRYWKLGPGDGPRILIDAFTPAAYGGTGAQADWNLAAGIALNYAGLLLAGGLTPDNVAEAVATVRPWGVDVASGVEQSPGRKDYAKVRAFIAAVRKAAAILPHEV